MEPCVEEVPSNLAKIFFDIVKSRFPSLSRFGDGLINLDNCYKRRTEQNIHRTHESFRTPIIDVYASERDIYVFPKADL